MSTTEPQQMTLPLAEGDAEKKIVGETTLIIRESAERRRMRDETRMSHECIEQQLAQGNARQGTMTSACAYLVEQLPKVLKKLVDLATDGNPSACKVFLDLAGLGEEVTQKRPQHPAPEGLPPIEIGLLENLREQIARLPDQPDPLDEP